MEIENDSSINKKTNFFSFIEGSSIKESNINNKLLLSDGIFRSKQQTNISFLFNNNSSREKKNSLLFTKCPIISSLFTKDNINKAIAKRGSNHGIIKKIRSNNLINSNDIQQNIKKHIKFSQNNIKENTKENNTTPNQVIINYKIYNIKENSIFHIKVYDKYIKFYPIFSNLTDYEKFICYNPLIENNAHFGVIPSNCNHEAFCIKDYEISSEKLEILKDKYVKHLYTKRNIILVEEIFKYIFEEIKINLSCINIQSPYDNVLKNCSNLINSINEIIINIINEKKGEVNLKNKNNITKIENINNFEITKKKDYSLINNNIPINNKKVFVLGEINSKSIQSNFLEINKNNSIEDDFDNNQIENDDEIEKEDDNKNEEKNKKDNFTCLYCSKKFNSHCGLGGHMSKRHPKNQNK